MLERAQLGNSRESPAVDDRKPPPLHWRLDHDRPWIVSSRLSSFCSTFRASSRSAARDDQRYSSASASSRIWFLRSEPSGSRLRGHVGAIHELNAGRAICSVMRILVAPLLQFANGVAVGALSVPG